MDQLMLLKPGRDYSEQIFLYRQEFLIAGDPIEGTDSLYRLPDPEDWLAQVTDLSKPETTPENWDVTSQYICVRPFDNRLVGMIQIKHTLNPYLAAYGGHIGFSVLPSERGKGYATWMLKTALLYCPELGLDQVILACDPACEAGKRVIAKNGGVFFEKVFDPEYEMDVERYRIDVRTR